MAAVHGQEVLEAFKKADKDGNGLISRQELAQLFKQLDPEGWDDTSVDRVMAMADTSGDGHLYYEEFVKWMLAEDLGPQQANVSGDFSFVLSGCSREELNGEYVQQEKFYGHRPVFYCAENKRVLYYHKANRAWQIFWKTKKNSSALVRTTRAPHMLSKGECWRVWRKGSGFTDDPSMSCRQVAETREAPERLYFYSPTVTCPMQKTGTVVAGRPTYRSADSTCQCVYVDGHDGFSGWTFFDKTKYHGLESLVKSLPTRCYSPLQCLWADDVRVLEEPGARVEAPSAPEQDERWVDPNFPPTPESMGPKHHADKCRGQPEHITWSRLSDLGTCNVLFDEDNPLDLKQGMVGDCWLIGDTATMGEFQPYLRDHVFKTKGVAPDGRYEIRLFDFKTRDWVIHEVDDLVPCFRTKTSPRNDKVIFCDAGSMWGPLLEKLFAKIAGSWDRLDVTLAENRTPGHNRTDGLDVHKVLYMLTGGNTWHSFRNFRRERSLWWTRCSRVVTAGPEPSSAKKGELQPKAYIEEVETAGMRMKYTCSTNPHHHKEEGTPEEGWITAVENGRRRLKLLRAAGWAYARRELGDADDFLHASKPGKTLEEIEGIKDEAVQTHEHGALHTIHKAFFKKMLEVDQASCVMWACFIGSFAGERLANGLVAGHSYTVVHVKEISGFKLLALRNTWGYHEWNGAWSDGSEEWETYPDVAKALEVECVDDGLFWMELQDFLGAASQVFAVQPPEPLARHAAML